MKKTLLLSMMAVLSLTASALSSYEVTMGGLVYTVKPNNMEANVEYPDWETFVPNVIIPATIEVTEGDYPGTYQVTSLKKAFYLNTDLTSITIGKNVRELENEAFYYCENLESVTFEEGSQMTMIGKEAFYKCGKVKTLNLPSTITTIKERAFELCKALETVTLPTSLTTIGEYAFVNCYELASITIPSSVKTIETAAFDGCTKLATVTLSEGLETLGGIAFSRCAITEFHIPASVTLIDGNPCAHCSQLTTVTVTAGSTSYVAQDNVVYTKDMTKLLMCVPTKEGSFAVPAGVTTIANSAFRSCLLTDISLPESIVNIEGYAFYQCKGLTAMTIPEGVTELKTATFYECTALRSVILPSTITEVGFGAFYGCSSLADVFLKATIVPTDNGYGFDGRNKKNLHVPTASLDAYKTTDPWNQFKNIDDNFSGISTGIGGVYGQEVERDQWYNLNGRRIQGAPTQRGLYLHQGKKVVR